MRDNPHKRFIEELASLDASGSKVVDYGAVGEERVHIHVAKPATAGEIAGAEDALGHVLPPSLVSFLTAWNGAVLYKGEYRPGCRVFGTDELVTRNRIWLTHELLPEERLDTIVLFVDFGDGDYAAFDTARQDTDGEYSVLDGDHNVSPGTWRPIAKSFAEWLARLVEVQGCMFW